MKSKITSMFRSRLKYFVHFLAHRTSKFRDVAGQFNVHPHSLLQAQTDNKIAQIALMQQYRHISETAPASLLKFNEAGFRQYSQNEEDGLLLYIFSLIKSTNKKCVEVCVADGMECNTLNLILNHGWWGLLFDGSKENIEIANMYYGSHKDTMTYAPKTKAAWITAENINTLIAEQDFEGEIDLLSIDIDGNDYWIWNAITVVEPRVVVIEYHNPVPPTLALTVPYDPRFAIESLDDDFRGASLLALVRLGKSKGYRLVGANRLGFNAFFVKDGIGEGLLPEVSPESCARDPYTKKAQQKRWPNVKHRPWVAV